MERTLVMVPVDLAQAGQVAHGRALPGPLRAFAANRALAQTFGLEDATVDELEFAALQVAQVAGLARHGLRLVVTASVVPELVAGPDPDEADNGGVLLSQLPVEAVEAFFTDPAPLDPELVTGAQGLDVDAAWTLPGVAPLLAQAPLAWHDITELGEWLPGQTASV